jgi:hypothetical protein
VDLRIVPDQDVRRRRPAAPRRADHRVAHLLRASARDTETNRPCAPLLAQPRSRTSSRSLATSTWSACHLAVTRDSASCQPEYHVLTFVCRLPRFAVMRRPRDLVCFRALSSWSQAVRLIEAVVVTRQVPCCLRPVSVAPPCRRHCRRWSRARSRDVGVPPVHGRRGVRVRVAVRWAGSAWWGRGRVRGGVLRWRR